MSTVAELSPRSQDEIVARYHSRLDGDPLGFEVGEYIGYLDYEHAKPFLKPETTEESWNEIRSTMKPPIDTIRDYMDFAFDKAFDCRGISANRSVQHIIAWLWLTGDDEFTTEISDMYESSYDNYGVDILRRVCNKLDWNTSQFGDPGGYPRG